MTDVKKMCWLIHLVSLAWQTDCRFMANCHGEMSAVLHFSVAVLQSVIESIL